MLILIMLEISIREDHLQDTCSPLEAMLLVGKLLFSHSSFVNYIGRVHGSYRSL